MAHGSASQGYDIIGDVHGCAEALMRLLEKLGYRPLHGVYQHPQRKVIFLGDIIDRGPQIPEALQLVRGMVEAGQAQMVLGNHECNALAYFTRTDGHYLRAHSERNTRQLAETQAQFTQAPELWQSYLDWFLALPLFLEFAQFRVVHACWDAGLIARHRERYGEGHINGEFLHAAAQPGTLEARVQQRLTSGVDLPLPEGLSIVSRDGYRRHSFRIKFWVADARTYEDLLFQPDPLPPDVAQRAISPEHREQMVIYGAEQRPLFIGHYWLAGSPRVIAPNIACLDYSAVNSGRLVAYRFDGETQLRQEKLVWVYANPWA